MSAPIKFNVIVPTRERADTLFHCLRTVVAQDYENLQIIVSDNFSQDDTREVVASLADGRVTYINTGERLSMSHNWEFALDQATDGWVMFVGDDDGLYPDALESLDALIRAHDVEAVSSTRGKFVWPGDFDQLPGGHLVVPLTASVAIRSTRVALERVFAGLAPYEALPWLYTGGAASLHLVNRARDPKGRFFCSWAPDLYSAVALSLATDKYLWSEVPFAINGASRHSIGRSSLSGTTATEKLPALQFLSEPNIPCHEKLVLGKSLHIVLYESYLQSWHIHGGDPSVSMERMLEVAAATAPPHNREEILQQCRTIASKNGVRFAGAGMLLKANVQRSAFARQVRSSYWSVGVDADRLGVANVYDAALDSSFVYKTLRVGVRGLRLFLFFRLALKTLSKLSRAMLGKSAGRS